MPLSQGLSGLEAVAEKLDAIIKLMFECEFKLNSQAIRAAEEYPEVLARTRYLFVEHSRPSNALKHLLEEIPDIFLRRRFKSCVPSSYSLKSTKTSAEGSAAVFPKADKTPWEAPVFALKRLQQEVKKVWVERMIFTQNRQLLLHVAFLVVVLYVAAEIVGMDLCIVSRDALQQALRTRLVEEEWEPANGYMEIATPSNWWQWAEGPLLDAIYEPTLPTWDKKGKLKSSDDNVSSRFPLLGGLAFAVSQPRLRMFGTLPDEKHLGACSYKPGTQRLGRNGESCFSFFDANVELDEALEQDVPVSSATAAYAFDYKARAKGWLHVEAPVIYGHQAYYPGTGGYIAGFPKDPAAGEEMLHTLRNSSWLSQNTRAIVLEFMAFSASDHHSHNLLATVRLLAEFTPTGAVMCSGHIRAVRLWLYRTSRDFVRAVLEVVWVLAVCLQFRSEVRQLATAFQRDISANRRTSSGFLAQFYRVRRGIADYADVHFNLIDLGHFHVFIWLIAVHTLSLAYTAHVDWDDLFEADNTDRSTRRDLSTAAVAIQMAEIRLFLLGVYVMLSFLTLLDRMRVRESLHVLIIEEMFKKIFTFLIVMSVCVLGFSFTAFFSRLGGAQGPMGGRASGLIGEIDYEKAYNSDPRFGVVFCIISFMVLPVLLMNLLIAIMLEAYAAVKDYAAARFCYLQLVAYSDYTRSHDEYMGLVVHPGVTHWLALGV
ncbi:hypothetical protein CTAYLR_007672 [Chrysophaeum taylorii]|uniref:Polycystin domain-containing protein n=1 Tax=Chrysophaeum taylorii TaxID=2483200 RepID=A0AAD7U823_9STRA|nr:hypothetical protein CTAYLR_007672 [Chrysophaeum taylorii]